MFKEEMRYDYPLTPDSLVWDIGGYKGDFAQKIYDKHKCWVSVYEPIPEFTKSIEKKVNDNLRINVFNYGLSHETTGAMISVNNDSSSTHRGGRDVPIQLIDVKSEMVLYDDIDLMKINIEGEEFNLLERMLECDIIKQVKYIQVQFHAFIPNAKERRARIQEGLKKTHKLMWNYDFIWESWERI